MGIQAINGLANYGDDCLRAIRQSAKKIKPSLPADFERIVASLPPIYHPPVNISDARTLVDMVNKPSASESIKKLRELIANGDVIPKISHLAK
jgi:hypothetical protein